MDFLSGLGNLANFASTLGDARTTLLAKTTEDPTKRELYNKRDLCNQRLKWKKLKYMLVLVIIPLILIILGFLAIDRKIIDIPLQVFIIPGIWLFLGFFWLAYLSSIGWARQSFLINTADINQFNPCPK